LADSHGLKQLDVQRLESARAKLQEVYQQAHTRPRPYYAILVLDGDNMGKRIDACLEENDPEAAHRRLSEQLSQFAEYVGQEVKPGFLVYVGGDDVLALAPLSQALPLAQTLAARFHAITGGTASVGIAIAHHLYPLDATLEAARAAEKQAKQVPDKAAVCVRVLKRSGETVEVRSPWNAMGETFGRLVTLFQTEALSNKLAYAVAEAAYALPDPDAMFEAELRRLLHRHRHRYPTKWSGCEAEWAATLRTWAAGLPGASTELGHWLILARFIAQGGEE
jgi:CRISPR-associated protein Cmr2